VYRRFLLKVKDQSEFKRKRLQDILVEPVQRISRYSMMIREILQLTPEDHPDYQGLKAASEKAREIATMADDDPTKTATMFLNLYQGIKDSPVSSYYKVLLFTETLIIRFTLVLFDQPKKIVGCSS
jgi:hypothetical protein